MTAAPTFSRNLTLGDIALAARNVVRRSLWPLLVCLGIAEAALALGGHPGATAFALIACGSVIVFVVWAQSAEGMPLMPMLALQNLIAYGLPLLTNNETVMPYPAAYMTKAGLDVFVFNIALIAAWRIGMEVVPRASKLCYALQGFDSASPRLIRLGLIMVVATTTYAVLRSAGLLDPLLGLLPQGSESILHVLVSAVSACGFFLAAMMIGRGGIGPTPRGLFWFLLTLQCVIEASGFLLSSTITVLFSVVIGLFWGGGRIPWRLLFVSATLLSFLNLGKAGMREKYWTEADAGGMEVALSAVPQNYIEWIDASWGAAIGRPVESDRRNAFQQFRSHGEDTSLAGQTLLERINNLQNLLFVVDAMDAGHIKPLGGATYSLIPPLLVPRILWPSKPRTHEGQVLLNVHFGRQDLGATFHTYVAWGLLPEAYGNFGPITGAIVLGTFLGFLFAWIEKYVARKLVLSLEGFLSFTVFLAMANSFEMVASVLVTSLFQACVPIVLASAPFVERVLPKPREA